MYEVKQKYNHKQLIRDLRGEDDDLRIFALRTIIKLERGNLKRDAGAVEELEATIGTSMTEWPEEVRFYGQRALEHLATLRAPEEPEEEEDDQTAEIDLENLASDDPDLVLRCLKRIEAQEHTPALAKVKELLSVTTDSLILSSLLSALAAIGGSTALFDVKGYTTHPNARVRSTCVDAIARLADEESIAVGMIEPMLADRDGAVKARAIVHIGPIDYSKVEATCEALAVSPVVGDRVALAAAVCEISNDSPVNVMKKLAEDSEEVVRMKLVESMTRTDHPQKIFMAQKMKRDPAIAVRRIVREAIKQYETKRMLQMGGFNMEQPKELATKMKSLDELAGEEEIDPLDLEDLKHRDKAVKLACLHKIQQRAHQKAHGAVLELLGVSEDPDVLSGILRSLTVIGSGRDLKAIVHFLTHTNGDVRAAAAAALEQVADKSQLIVLVLPMMHDPDPLVRGAASQAMLRFETTDVLQHVQAMAGHQSVPIRCRLVHFLSHYSGALVRSYLPRFVRDAAPQVRSVLATVRYPDDAWADEVLERLSRDADEQVRTLSTRALLARRKRRESGREQEEIVRPDLGEVLAVANRFVLEAEEEAERRAEEAVAQRARDLAAAADEEGKGKGIVTRAAEAALQERETLRSRRDMLREAMGKKLFTFIKRKEVTHEAYDRCVFLLQKYLHLEKTGGGKEEDSSLWGKLTKMAGGKAEDTKGVRHRAAMRERYIELGKTALELYMKESVIHDQLQMEYLELEEIERKIMDMENVDASSS